LDVVSHGYIVAQVVGVDVAAPLGVGNLGEAALETGLHLVILAPGWAEI